MTKFLSRRSVAPAAFTVALYAPVARFLLGESSLAADAPALDPGDPTAKTWKIIKC